MQEHGKPPAGMKLFPRNLTARADYVVRGNPAVSRPESGADNCHPGLEFDQRNLDRYFFPGLLFDFQFGAGARLAEVRSPWREEREENDRRRLDESEGEFFLWYIQGYFGDQPDTSQFVDLFGLDGYDVLRKVHDLEPNKSLILVVGRRPDDLRLDNVAVWLRAGKEVKALVADLEADRLQRGIKTFRDPQGNLQFAVLSGPRARYLSDDGVIDVDAVEPGALTQSLCSPWQWDFTDCGCFYWAASRPDIVTGANGKEGLNFLRRDRDEASAPPPTDTWNDWMDPRRTMVAPEMIMAWETLPVVVADKETSSYRRPEVVKLQDPWDRNEVISWLKYLAKVEHALCVKFLYAHYSVKAAQVVSHGQADNAAPKLTKVAQEVFEIAIDEMRHFRWVNEALGLLGVDAVVDRADQLKRLRDGEELEPIDLTLEALTPAEVDLFIEVESPSNRYEPHHLSGLYTHILVSLEQQRDEVDEYTPEVRERLQEICKLIIDEGDGHWHRAERVRGMLAGEDPDQYLRYKGPPIRQPPDTDCGSLQILGDQYYHLMLDILRLAFTQSPTIRGRTLKQAQRVMRNLHEVGYELAVRGKGLLFTKPPSPSPGSSPASAVSYALTASIPNILAPLRALGLKDAPDLATRHAEAAADLQKALEDDSEDENP